MKYKYFRFGGRHLGLSTSGYIGIIGDITAQLVEPENIGEAVEIVFLSTVLADIYVLPV